MTVAAIGKSSRINGISEAENWLCNSLLVPLLEAASRFAITAAPVLALTEVSRLTLQLRCAKTCWIDELL